MFDDRTSYAPLSLFEYDTGKFVLSFPDSRMGPAQAVFEANGRENNGYGWTDVVIGVVRAEDPQLETRIGLDPEAGTFTAFGSDLDALKAVGAIAHQLFHDHTKLAEAVRNAPWEFD